MKTFTFLTLIFCFSCVNYNVTVKKPASPILVSINKLKNDSEGYEVVFRVLNNSYFFIGYTLLIDSNPILTRLEPTKKKSYFCTNLNLYPNISNEYSLEITPKEGNLSKPDKTENQNRVCKLNIKISPGNYITMRSILASINSEPFITYSDPSNTLRIP